METSSTSRSPSRGRAARFLAVGASGLVVNELALAGGVEVVGWSTLVAAIVATQCSTSWNFVLSERWAFREHGSERPLLVRLARYFAVNNVALAARGPVLAGLILLGAHYLLANLVTLAALTVVRFALADRWIWPGQDRRMASSTNATTSRLENSARAVTPS